MSDSDDGRASGLANPSARYQELLRPCRDLAANWNVDIVAKLSAYLVELDINIDPLVEAAQVNFQHAALVIEGGTCVYSRKVDYLYALVFDAADMIYDARGKTRPSKKSRAGTSAAEDDADGTPTSNDIDFLLLDNQMDAHQPEHERITLPLRDFEDESEILRLRDVNRIISIPLHLLPPGPQNTRRASVANANNTGLRMPDATINDINGALILDGIGVETVERSLNRFNSNSTDVDDDAASDGGSLGDDGGDAFPPQVDFDHDDDDSSGFGSAFAQAGGPPEDAPIVAGDLSSVARSDEKTAGSSKRRERSPDPYQPLDPHDASAAASRPAQRAKTWNRPEQMSWLKAPLDNQSRGDFAELANAEGPSYLDLLSCILDPKACSLKRKTNRFVSFEAAKEPFRTRLRHLSVAKRRRTRLLSAKASDGGDEDTDSAGDDGADSDDGLSDTGAAFDNAPDGGDGSAAGDDIPDFPELDNDGGDDPFGDLGLDIQDNVELRVEKIAASYEDACRKYLLESSKLWQEHAVDSQLEERVADWRMRIEPLLAEEEERPAFDIQEYGNAILDRFAAQQKGTDSRESDMATVFGTSEPFEVCRNFLATLQLVNSNKIEIVSPSSGGGENLFNPTIALVDQARSEDEPDEPASDLEDDTPARTPVKAGRRLPLLERTGQISNVPDAQSSPPTRTPKRRPPGKRHRQAGGTPVSARRAASKARTAAAGSPVR